MECPKVITSAYDFIKWAIPHTAKFPRDQRYTLGDRIEGKLFYLLDLLIEAQYSKDKFGALKAANLGIEQMRHLFRLCYDLRLINLKTFEMIRRVCSGSKSNRHKRLKYNYPAYPSSDYQLRNHCSYTFNPWIYHRRKCS